MIMIWILNESFTDFIFNFTATSWIMVIAASILVLLAQMAKYMALQNQ
jgi:hypothetical protein